MKRIFSAIAGVCLMLMVATPALAGPWRIENGARVIAKTEVVQGDLIFNGEQLRVDGTITGDLIIESGEIVINGRIEGSVIGFTGGKITVNGRIDRNLRAIAREIAINGNVAGNATVGAFQLVSAARSRIGDGLFGTFLLLKLAGRINGPVDVTGLNSAELGGRIAGAVKVNGGRIEWLRPVEILGKVSDYTVQANDPARLKGVKVGGYHFYAGNLIEQYQLLKLIMMVSFIWLAGSLLLSLISYRLFPRTVWSISEPSAANFRHSLLTGMFGLFATPLVIYFLLLTVVGIPIAIFILLLYLLLLISFGIPVYLWLGRLIFKSKLRPGLLIVLGALLQTVIIFIPLFGILFQLLFVGLGVGMIIGKIRFQFREKIDWQG